MKLKNITYILFILTLGTMTSACSDWLDYNPKDKQTYEQQFSTREGFHNAVNGVYNSMTSAELYGYNLSYGAIEAMGLCYSVSESNTNMIQLKNASYTSDNAAATLRSIWASAYRCVLNINLILQALEEHPDVLLPDDAKMIEGEMLAARACIHLDLVRLFGPIYSEDPAGLSVPFADKAEIIKRDRLPAQEIINNKILPDLLSAQAILKEVDPVLTDGVLNSDIEDGDNWFRYRQVHLNYYAVCLLTARAYIWMNDYENALIQARKLVDDSAVAATFPWVDPVKLLANNNDPDRVFSTECLFGYYNGRMSDIFENNFNGNLAVSQVLQPRSGYLNILFPNNSDYRRQSQWAGSTSSVSASDYDFTKYKSFTTNPTNPEFWATFYGLMRVSEAYYIASEACMELGDITQACDYLNVVKNARNIPGTDEINTILPNELLKELKYEYLREFRGEGQIFFMLKRFKQEFASDNPDFNGAEVRATDNPVAAVRYNVPIPADENY